MSKKISKLTPETSKKKGQNLARLDKELKMINSGPLGSNRLILNIAIDFQEKHRNMTWNQALFSAMAYYDRVYNQI